MPAFRGKNLRSGDLNEEWGGILLQHLALVAPVPRTEDVGVDVVATLLDDFDKTRLKATNSFYVQIKSSSVESIEYVGAEVEWLFALELPFFIARVNRQQLRAELYCCHALHEAYVVNHARSSLRIEFEKGPEVDSFMSANDVVNVGPPVFTWTMTDINQVADLRKQFFAVCTAHIAAIKQSMELRRVGRVETLVWKSNQLPETVGYKLKDADSPAKITTLSDLAVPYLVPFLDLCVRHGDDEWLDQILRLVQDRRYLLFMIREMQKKNSGQPIEVPEEFRFILQRQAEEKAFIKTELERFARLPDDEE